jgi:hypothetical protein
MELIQYWEGDLPQSTKSLMDSVAKINSDYEYIRFTRESAIHWIEANLGQAHAVRFLRLKIPASQADYFRVAYVLKKGGCYLDARCECSEPINYWAVQTKKLQLIRKWHGRICNGFIQAPASHPLLQEIFDNISNNIDNNIEGVWKATGPKNFIAAIDGLKHQGTANIEADQSLIEIYLQQDLKKYFKLGGSKGVSHDNHWSVREKSESIYFNKNETLMNQLIKNDVASPETKPSPFEYNKTKKRIFLHIGRHKSGTSSLQNFLNKNEAILKQKGYSYPNTDNHIAHHNIATYFNKRHLARSDEKLLISCEESVGKLKAYLNEADGDIIISSEAFQNANPKLVSDFFLEYDVVVIVYLRDHLSYAISSYQQRVHAQYEYKSLDSFIQSFKINYLNFLTSWSSQGFSKLIVRPFTKTGLKNGDIIEDFCHVIGLDFNVIDFISVDDMNPSIGGALLDFKRVLNSCANTANTKLSNKFYGTFTRIASAIPKFRERPHASEKLFFDYLELNKADLHKINTEYFLPSEFLHITNSEAQLKTTFTISDLHTILNEISKSDILLTNEILSLLYQNTFTSSATEFQMASLNNIYDQMINIVSKQPSLSDIRLESD